MHSAGDRVPAPGRWLGVGDVRLAQRDLSADGVALPEELGGSLLGELFFRRGEEILEFVKTAGGAQPRPVAGESELTTAVALAGVGGRGWGDVGFGGVGAAELLALGADLGGGVREGAGGEVGRGLERPLDERAEGAHFATGGATGALGEGVGIPGAGELGDGGAGAVSMSGEHRADAARGGVDVGTDDDAIGVDAAEHGLLGVLRKALDGDSKVVGGAFAGASHFERCSGDGEVLRGSAGFRNEMLQVEELAVSGCGVGS